MSADTESFTVSDLMVELAKHPLDAEVVLWVPMKNDAPDGDDVTDAYIAPVSSVSRRDMYWYNLPRTSQVALHTQPINPIKPRR